MTSMILYTVAVSPNCRRAEAAVYHLGLEDRIHVEVLDFTSGYLQSDAFLAINPNGKVPVLSGAGDAIWESNAILHDLAELAGDDAFRPDDPRSRTEILRWQFWESLHFNKAVGEVAWETTVKKLFGMGEADHAAVERALGDFRRFAAILEARLEKSAFILGEDVSIADFSVGNHSALALHDDTPLPLDDFPRIRDWYNALEKVPAWARTAPWPVI